eukprot:934248-Pelagomonas_calceolata.AAC.1
MLTVLTLLVVEGLELRADRLESSLSAIILLSFSFLDLSSFSACRTSLGLNFMEGGQTVCAPMWPLSLVDVGRPLSLLGIVSEGAI